MKVLFVDDEARILTGIENALIFDHDDWEADFANSGQIAIDRLTEHQYDVLVTDMQMPGLTGADVLEHAKEHSPRTLRIVLSGEVNEDLAQRAMPLTHEFVSKPCDPDSLFEIVERVFSSSRPLADASGVGVLSILDRLPSQPDLFLQVQEAIQRGASADSLARIIENDLSITTSIIRIANSSFYGGRRPTENARDAIARLGLNTLTGILLRTELSDWTPPTVTGLVTRLNIQAVKRSQVLSTLVTPDTNHAAQAGLLCDIGILALLALHPERVDDIEEIVADGDSTAGGERIFFGTTHSVIGAAMLDMWKFAPTVVDAVRFHHCYEATDGPGRAIAEAIAAADLACLALAGQEYDRPPDMDELLLTKAIEAWERTNSDD